MPSSQYNFLKKFELRIPFFFNQKQKIVGFLRSIVRNRFHKTAEFQDILPRLTLEKEANSWKIAKKNGYLYDCLLPWQQSATSSY